MQYGYFDQKNREYVITSPDTPAPWCNYLGSPEYGAIISNNAQGYSFVKSGANGRVTRYRFNSMMDLPGRFVYIRDQESGDYFSASWQPVGKDLKEYRSTCRHGMGYTVISSEYSGIGTEVTYYVPMHDGKAPTAALTGGRNYEVWRAKVKNISDKERKLSVFGFVEFTNEPNYSQDQVNLQYSLFISRTSFEGNRILQHINENEKKDETGSNHRERYLGLAGAKVSAYCGNYENYIGLYRTFANPVCVEKGKLDDSLNYNDNSCGALQTDMVLKPGEERELIFILGQSDNEVAGKVIERYEEKGLVDKEIGALKDWWYSRLDNLKVNTPSDEFNNMVNVWNAYQCFITFTWSRAASLIYCGLRNGYGYRDTVQDIQGIIHLDPEMALEKIRFMLSAQVSNGGGLPLVKFDHNAGHENTPDDPEYVQQTGHPSYRADDALWLFPTIYKYIGETGDIAFLDEKITYADGGVVSVYDHLKQAITFSMERMGEHHMPAGLHADWNDCLRLGAKGESTFVAFQLYYAIGMMKEIASDRNDTEYLTYLEKIGNGLSDALSKCWDEDRFIRGIRENGEIVGAKKDPEASMWLNPQSFCVISGYAQKDQAVKAMDSVHDILNTPYGAKLMEPPYVDHMFDGALMHIFNPDTKENGGIFSQSQGWLILAESLLGRGDRAFEYFMETSPAAMNEKAEHRVIEPYAHGQFVESTRSPYAGRAHVHWLTGTASTVMVGCVEGILGLRPDAKGLRISPSIPSAWKEFEIEKNFRGKKLYIKVLNENGSQSGVRELTLNGKTLGGDHISASELEAENRIVVKL
ncbi:MAG: N,N'-diacetylchitobiose phosphorylase [Lachnospiraceae bacterium]|nr:N,N'-diacetylchitobiose phosphorylase [Lachnospiraceae bacterium]